MDAYNRELQSLWAPFNAPTLPTPLHLHQQQCGSHTVNDDEFQAMCASLLRNDAVEGAAFASLGPASPSDESAAMLLPSTKRASDSNGVSAQPAASPHRASVKPEDATAAKHSHRQVKLKTKEAEKRLLALAKHHATAEAENTRLKSLDKKLSACVVVANFQTRLSEIVHRSPRSPLPLPASCSQVSFSELPPSCCWDAPWISRIQQLQPQDLLVLRRQWAQQSAVLLPQALAYGPGSDAYKTMERLHNKHLDLVRALLALAPSVWLESSQFDMDTLRPIKAPSAEWVRDLFVHLAPREALPALFRLGTEYDLSTGHLQSEYRRLLQQYKALAQDLNLQQQLDLGDWEGGAAAACSSFGFGAPFSQLSLVSSRVRVDCPPAYLEVLQQLDDTAKLLQANTSKQRVALLKLFSALYNDFHPRHFNFVLMMYPLACTSVDFVPGFLLLGDATSSAPPSPPPVAPRA